MTTSITLHTDGGARGNPGPAATGFLIHQQDSLLVKSGRYLGETTNNTAEYAAVLDAIYWIVVNRDQLPSSLHLSLFLDSQLVVKQLQGEYKITKPHLQDYVHTIDRLIKSQRFEVSYTHIPRAQNQAADAIVNQILDSLFVV